MSALNNASAVKAQYASAEKLRTRISIHEKYSTNKQGFGSWIAEHYPISEGMSVLELGCGTGEIWLHQSDMIRKCAKIILTDFSKGMLAKAKETLKQYPKIEYALVDMQDIPYANKSFDLVIANMVLYHVPDIQRGIAESRRVLRDGGIFCCATYGEQGIMEYLSGLFKDYGSRNNANHTFTLQNGEAQLKKHFAEVVRYDYKDSLKVTDVNDLVDFINSLEGLSQLRTLPRETMMEVLQKAAVNGVLHVPKDYGMFLSR